MSRNLTIMAIESFFLLVPIRKTFNINLGVHINGNNHIQEGAYIGSGAVTIKNYNRTLDDYLGTGAVVIGIF